jgi:hypothetical protein
MHSSSRPTFLAAILFLALPVCAPSLHAQGAPAANPLPLYVVGPPNSHDINQGLCFRELFEHPEQWQKTRALTNALLYADWAFRDFSDKDLAAWFAQMQQWNIKLELEVGGIKPWGVTGEGTFTKQKASWDRIERLGGTIYSIAMDEPLCCVRGSMHLQDEYAIEQTADFIGLVRKNYPYMLVGDVEPYPFLPLNDQMTWIAALQKRLADKGIRGLDFYRVDTNWVNFNVQQVGSWHDIKKLEQYCRSAHLPFSLIYWSPQIDYMKRLGFGDDSTWLTDVMSQGYAYAAVRGAPDQYVLESWVNAPAHSVPETADYSFTRSALDFGRKFVKPAQ